MRAFQDGRAAVCSLVLFAATVLAAEPGLVIRDWVSHRLTDAFYAEGACIGDFNNDGHADVCVGPFVYEGPAFLTRREMAPVESIDPHAYSNLAFLSFAHDIDNDGWVDVLHVGWPGKETHWFRNPAGKRNTLTGNTRGHWDKFVAFPVTDNESPVFADLTGDGKPDLVCSTGGRYGYANPDPADPTKPWAFHPVGEDRKLGRYTHGLGVGDVNGDGLPDLLEKDGWYQNPGKLDGDPLWTHHPVSFSGGRGGAQMFAYDVDGDGDQDVIASLDGHGFGLAWFENTGAGGNGQLGFTKHLITGAHENDSPFGVKFSQLHGLALADMNGDGLLDIVTGKRFWAHGPKGDPEPEAIPVLYWFQLTRKPAAAGQAAAVEYMPHRIHDASGVGCQVTVGDLNGDGHPDVAVGNKLGTFIHLQRPRSASEAEWQAAQPKRLY